MVALEMCGQIRAVNELLVLLNMEAGDLDLIHPF